MSQFCNQEHMADGDKLNIHVTGLDWHVQAARAECSKCQLCLPSPAVRETVISGGR